MKSAGKFKQHKFEPIIEKVAETYTMQTMDPVLIFETFTEHTALWFSSNK